MDNARMRQRAEVAAKDLRPGVGQGNDEAAARLWRYRGAA